MIDDLSINYYFWLYFGKLIIIFLLYIGKLIIMIDYRFVSFSML